MGFLCYLHGTVLNILVGAEFTRFCKFIIEFYLSYIIV